jgi:DNA-binding winged helix-turn-helix (wHTH) protein
MPLRFGECVFDGEARTLTRGGRRVALAPKALALLRALLDARPKALSQGELRDRLWPQTHVAYTSLPRVVSELRKAVGDDRRQPRSIRTVHHFGYAFVAVAVDEAGTAPSAFSLLRGRDEIPLREGENLIGRSAGCAVRVDSDRVSRRHARIVVRGSRATLEDLGSKNGTRVDGRRIEGTVSLGEGDLIGVGEDVLLFRRAPGHGSTRSDTAARSGRTRSRPRAEGRE